MPPQQDGGKDVRQRPSPSALKPANKTPGLLIECFLCPYRLMNEGFKGRVTGWGNLKEAWSPGERKLPEELQQIHLPIVDQDTCRSSTSVKVTNNMFCAGKYPEIVHKPFPPNHKQGQLSIVTFHPALWPVSQPTTRGRPRRFWLHCQTFLWLSVFLIQSMG